MNALVSHQPAANDVCHVEWRPAPAAASNAHEGLVAVVGKCDLGQERPLQRKPTPVAFTQRRPRRSCHGTTAEQQQQLLLCSIDSDVWEDQMQSYSNDTVAFVNCSIGSKLSDLAGEDADGSHKQDQQDAWARTLAPAEPAAAAPAPAAAASDSSQPPSRPRSPFAAAEVQDCTCYEGKHCKQHSSKASNGSSATAATGKRAARKAAKWVKKTAVLMWEGLAFAAWPAGTVPGMCGVAVGAH